jgi:DNA-directed RNA polymerase subunit E'
MIEIKDTIRIPPEFFGEDINKVVEEMVQKSFEGKVKRQYGMIVLTTNVKPMEEGVIIHGDGALYQKVKFDALIFQPELQEIVDGIVCEVVEFGVFCHIGAMDALVHMSQIMNDYVEINVENGRITGRESKKALAVGDTIRARIVSLSLNEVSPRESKIGLTMRQTSLGAHEWIKEDRKEKKEEKKTEKKKDVKKK